MSFESHNGQHIPVLLEEVVKYATLQDKASCSKGEIAKSEVAQGNDTKAKKNMNVGVFVDGTFGGGGYARGLLEAGAELVIGIDRDPLAVARGKEMKKEFGDRLEVFEGRFSEMSDIVKKCLAKSKKIKNKECVDGIVLDLGFSSYQLDSFERGFSFKNDGPLDMRMSGSGRTAAEVIAEEDQEFLADIFYKYGEEKQSRRIAKLIVERREKEPLLTTLQLAGLIEEIIPLWKGGGRHPAMRVFQALRIYVNQELEELENVLPTAKDLLAKGGRLNVVTFHSLEDRIVKKYFSQWSGPRAKNKFASHNKDKDSKHSKHPSEVFEVTAEGGSDFFRPFGKAIAPSEGERTRNSRSRSAKLRVLERAVA